MQIHISWKTLIAVLIFALGLVLVFRLSVARLSPTPPAVAEAPSATTQAADGATPVGANVTPSAAPQATTAVPPQVTSTPSNEPTPTATATAAPSAAAATPTAAPTQPPPTPTLAPPPTRVPTPVPAQLSLLEQGFGQRAGLMSYAFVVTNPNPELLAQDVRYQIAAYDANGVVLATDTDTIAQIGPGQTLGIAKDLQLASTLTVDRIDVLLRPSQFVRSPPLTTLNVSNAAFVDGDPPNATGIITNSFDRDLVDIAVVGIAYDENGIIGGGRGAVPFVPSQGQAAVSVPIATSLTATRVAFWVQLIAAPETP